MRKWFVVSRNCYSRCRIRIVQSPLLSTTFQIWAECLFRVFEIRSKLFHSSVFEDGILTFYEDSTLSSTFQIERIFQVGARLFSTVSFWSRVLHASFAPAPRALCKCPCTLTPPPAENVSSTVSWPSFSYGTTCLHRWWFWRVAVLLDKILWSFSNASRKWLNLLHSF